MNIDVTMVHVQCGCNSNGKYILKIIVINLVINSSIYVM
jgi:hypothetical protein